MSNPLAIAAVTRTMQALLQSDGLSVTTKTPDQAAKESGKRLNLFLYHTTHNASWRNQDIPGKVRKSERGNPPLALNLHYLLTAYGEDGTNLADQEMLGRAMLLLHDIPILKKSRIEQALAGYASLLASELADQIDKVRVVPEYLDIENMSRLWTTFQTQYRVSAAYQASVVLIESRRPVTTPLPVARRGDEDQGVLSDVGMKPMLSGIEYRGDISEPKMPAASIGSLITLLGDNLPNNGLTAVFRDPAYEQADQGRTLLDSDVVAELPVEAGGTDGRVTVKLSDADGTWRAGLLTVELRYSDEDKPHSTNPIPIAIAPQVLTSGGDASVVATLDESNDRRLLSLALTNPVRTDRRTMLTLNPFNADSQSQSVAPTYQMISIDSSFGSALSPVFDVTKVPNGEYWVRIRVDGVESLMMTRKLDESTGKYRLEFDSKQRVQLQ